MIRTIVTKRILVLLVILGVALAIQQRISLSTHIPLNVDEQMLIAEMQRMHGLPVHFIGYGWGENVLLAYVALPVVALGFDPLDALRVIVCVSSIITIILTALLSRRWFGDTVGIVTLFMGALWPWSAASGSVGFNVFLALPFLLGAGMLYGFYLRSGRSMAALAAGICIGIASYGYAIVFVWTFFFFIGSFFVSFRKKKLRGWWFMVGIFLFIAFPLVLFYAKNTFGLHVPESIGPLQFPTLTASRFGNIVVDGGAIQKFGAFAWNYLSHFNFFLLAVGLFSHRYSSYFSFAWDPFLIYIALWQLFKTNKMPSVLLFWLCLYPIGSSMTRVDGIFALTRDIVGMPALIILSSFGFVFIVTAIGRYVKKYIPRRL